MSGKAGLSVWVAKYLGVGCFIKIKAASQGHVALPVPSHSPKLCKGEGTSCHP